MQTIEIPTNDPVKMVRAIREKHYQETKDMTPEERREYRRKKAESFDRLMANVKPDPSRFPFLAKK